VVFACGGGIINFMLEFDFSALIDAFKSVFSLSIAFYKAMGNLILRLWDLLAEVVGFVRGFVNK